MAYRGVSGSSRHYARRLRSDMTDAERKLWSELRAHRLMGLGFRRQLPIGGYIVDFACSEHKLIVEVDGSQHGNDADLAYDDRRTARLNALGWTVLRVWNDDVLKDVGGVCDAIIRTIGTEVFR